MLNLYKFHYPFYQIEGGGGAGELSKDDILDELNAPDEEEAIDLNLKPEKKEVKKETPEEEDEVKEDEDEEEESEEVDELDELIDEIEEPDEEKLELIAPAKRSTILKKYPKLFEDFPYLEKAYYREQQFTEINPTIEDARLSKQKADTLDEFESKLLSGDIGSTLETVKKNDNNAFLKIVDNYLPTLAKVDANAFNHVLGTVINQTIQSMFEQAAELKNEKGEPHPGLSQAAHVLNQFVFGRAKFQPSQPLAKDIKEDPKKSEISERERAFQLRQFESTRDNLVSRISNSVKNTITQHIDPKESMTEYVRNAAIRDAETNLNKQMAADKRFEVILDKLWDNVFKTNFSKDSVDRLRSAWVSKARTLLPSVIKKARNEALKGLGKRVKNDDESSSAEDEKTPNPIKGKKANSQGPINKGRTDKDKARQIPKGMSSLDYLNSD